MYYTCTGPVTGCTAATVCKLWAETLSPSGLRVQDSDLFRFVSEIHDRFGFREFWIRISPSANTRCLKHLASPEVFHGFSFLLCVTIHDAVVCILNMGQHYNLSPSDRTLNNKHKGLISVLNSIVSELVTI